MDRAQRNGYTTQVTFNPHVPGLAQLQYGAGVPAQVQRSNWTGLAESLTFLSIDPTAQALAAAAALVCEVRGGTLEFAPQGPPSALQRQIERDTELVAVIDGVIVRLDCDQMKHQHPKAPIGTRVVVSWGAIGARAGESIARCGPGR